ncbi:coiled-coil alpha-helical rod protein 1 isoform X2 [Ambystoma mexicanum]
MPPSHFESRRTKMPAPYLPGLWTAARTTESLPCPATTVGPDPWATQSRVARDLHKQNDDGIYLGHAYGTSSRMQTQRGRGRTDPEEASGRARSLDRGCEEDHAAHRHALDISKQAEIISQQIRDIHRLEAESSGLRALSSQQATRLQEREETLTQLQEELKGLRVQLERFDVQRTLEAEKVALAHQAELERVRLQGQVDLERLNGRLSQELDQARADVEARRMELEKSSERHRLEVATLSEQLHNIAEFRERDKQRQEEMLQEQLQEAERKLHLQITAASEAHSHEAASLRQNVQALEKDLQTEREHGRKEATQLRDELLECNLEKEKLAEQLRKVSSNLNSQNDLVQQLRTYIGELVPDNSKTEEWRQERECFVDALQHLENERTGLRTTAELLNVRLSALSDILSIQEIELGKKAQNDALEVEAPGAATLLTCWRKKVFALMVQLQSQEINHENDARQNRSKISQMENELGESGQKQAVLLHSLQDKTAQLDLEKASHKAVQEELARTRAGASHIQHRAERAEEALQHLQDVVGSFHAVFLAQECGLKSALTRFGSLGQRITFAAKRVDTIQGMVARKMAVLGLTLEEQSRESRAGRDSGQTSYEELQEEVALLHRERDQLSSELKLSAQMITRKVSEAREKVDAELRDQQAMIGQLKEALEDRAESEQVLAQRLIQLQEQKEDMVQELQKRLSVAEAELQESCRAVEENRERLAALQDEYQHALQEKVSEAEARMLQQLAEMEKKVHEARREHTKAVVALRQAERQTARDKERTQELMKLQEEKHKTETERLCQQLKELERDRNLMTAALRQEGLLKQHRLNRSPALQSSDALQGEGHKDRPATPRLPEVQPLSKESLSAMLDNLQTLSAAIINEEEEGLSEEEEG